MLQRFGQQSGALMDGCRVERRGEALRVLHLGLDPGAGDTVSQPLKRVGGHQQPEFLAARVLQRVANGMDAKEPEFAVFIVKAVAAARLRATCAMGALGRVRLVGPGTWLRRGRSVCRGLPRYKSARSGFGRGGFGRGGSGRRVPG